METYQHSCYFSMMSLQWIVCTAVCVLWCSVDNVGFEVSEGAIESVAVTYVVTPPRINES